MIIERRDSVNFLVFHQIGDRLNESRLIDKIRKLRNQDFCLAVRFCLNSCDCTDYDLAAAGPVGILDSFSSEDHSTGRKIRTLHDIHNFLDCRFVPVYFIVQHLDTCTNDFSEVVRRHIGSHTDRNSRGSVDQQIRNPCRKDRRLLLRLIEVRHKIYRVFIDVSQHLHGYLGETSLSITHGCR